MAAVEELPPHPSKPYVLPARNTFDVVGINDVAALLTAIDGVNPFDVSPGMQLILERFVIRPDSANPFVYTTNVVDVKPDEIPSSVDAHGNTPLHLAAASGHILGVRILLERCACDVNAVNEDGWTPMHVAALHGRVENVEQLLRHGAKPTQPIAYNKNRQHLHAGRTALFLAHKHQHHAVVALLRPFCERISPLPPLADDGCISSDAIINVFLKAVLDLDVVVLCHIFDVLDCLHSVCGSMPLLWPHKLLPGLKGVGPAILPHVVPLQAAMMDAQLFVLDALVSRHMIEVGEPHLPPSVGAEDGTSTSEPQQQPQEEEAPNEEACAEPCAASAQDELSLLQRILNGGQVEALRMLLRTDANILRPRDPPLSSFIPAEGPNASTREELRKLIVERELKHEFDVAFAALKKKHHSKTLRRDAMEAKAAWREAQKELAELGLPLLA